MIQKDLAWFFFCCKTFEFDLIAKQKYSLILLIRKTGGEQTAFIQTMLKNKQADGNR